MSHLLLSAEDEQIYRDATADAWKKSNGHPVRARQILKRDPRIVGLDPMTILMILQIAWKLWQMWKDRNVSEPESVRRADEPCFGSQE
jgi:hypothetical protein